MDTKSTKLRDDKILRNYLNLTLEGRKAHLDLIAHLKMMEAMINEAKDWIDEKKLPRYSDVKKHNMINGQYGSKYLN
mgnify:CR=1 FL=1